MIVAVVVDDRGDFVVGIVTSFNLLDGIRGCSRLVPSLGYRAVPSIVAVIDNSPVAVDLFVQCARRSVDVLARTEGTKSFLDYSTKSIDFVFDTFSIRSDDREFSVLIVIQVIRLSCGRWRIDDRLDFYSAKSIVLVFCPRIIALVPLQSEQTVREIFVGG